MFLSTQNDKAFLLTSSIFFFVGSYIVDALANNSDWSFQTVVIQANAELKSVDSDDLMLSAQNFSCFV